MRFAVGAAGFVNGPRMLNTVGMPISRRGVAAKRRAGWNTGAKQKATPTSSRQRPTSSGPRSIATPSASRTSAPPLLEDAARLPCLTTGTPHALTTRDDIVEMLTVPCRSPPVPTMSTQARSVGTRRE